VTLAADKAFAELVAGAGLEFRAMTGDMRAGAESDDHRGVAQGPVLPQRSQTGAGGQAGHPRPQHRCRAAIRLKRLTADHLTATIREATGNPIYTQRARELATKINSEDGAARVLDTVNASPWGEVHIGPEHVWAR
jgi:UDP:flavonoid glycosyltransferase YjiC (YdhE family)